MAAGGGFQTGGYGEYRVGAARRGTGQRAGPHYYPGQKGWGKSTRTEIGGGRGGRRPRFGQYPTLTGQQQTILSQLMRGGPGPTYGPVGLGGAGERAGALSRMMAVSPEEERTAIERMSAPAMRQFREEILPGIRGTAGATGTLWSTMRAGEEARAGAGLAESLAGMGEQYRMQRRGQAMQAAGLGAQEALGAAGLGMQQYGMQMQRGGQREQMLAQLLGIPMMGVYSYPRGGR